MIRICDSHCHLQDRKLSNKLNKIIDSAREVGVTCMIVPGYDIQSSRKAEMIAQKYENIYSSAGIHPHDAKKFDNNAEASIRRLLESDNVIAVGETGLDYYRDLSPRKKQKEVFRKHLEIAEERNLPVIIHTRDSIDDSIDIAGEFDVKGVFHAFDYGVEIAEKIIEMGFYMGIGGVVTYKNSKISSSIKDLPLDRILLETDSPYLTPHPHRGQVNEPAFTLNVLQEIAKIKSKSIEEIAEITFQNTQKLFGI